MLLLLQQKHIKWKSTFWLFWFLCYMKFNIFWGGNWREAAHSKKAPCSYMEMILKTSFLFRFKLFPFEMIFVGILVKCELCIYFLSVLHFDEKFTFGLCSIFVFHLIWWNLIIKIFIWSHKEQNILHDLIIETL